LTQMLGWYIQVLTFRAAHDFGSVSLWSMPSQVAPKRCSTLSLIAVRGVGRWKSLKCSRYASN
jgi:hypothetical protein